MLLVLRIVRKGAKQRFTNVAPWWSLKDLGLCIGVVPSCHEEFPNETQNRVFGTQTHPPGRYASGVMQEMKREFTRRVRQLCTQPSNIGVRRPVRQSASMHRPATFSECEILKRPVSPTLVVVCCNRNPEWQCYCQVFHILRLLKDRELDTRRQPDEKYECVVRLCVTHHHESSPIMMPSPSKSRSQSLESFVFLDKLFW
jgi:hypothetical protein